MKRVVLTSVVLFALTVLMACGSKSQSPSSTLTMSPTTASVKTGGTQTFTVTQKDNPYPAVTWSVNDKNPGDMTVGTINYSGTYIAPAKVPSPAKVTVKATLISDSTQTATAEVTITQGDAVTISLTPTEVTVPSSQTQLFTATVSNTAYTAVEWRVNDVLGGDSVHGTIDQYGMFRAPSTPPDPNTVTIKATSVADPDKSATATITITPFTYISVTPSVVPALGAGAQQQFTAKLNGQDMNDAIWSLHCKSDVEGACGSISATGLYTAPLSPPPGGDVSVIAASSDPLIHSGGAVVTIQFSNASLTGKYALSFSGKDGASAYTAAGSVTFDGNSGITGGELDISDIAISHLAVSGGEYHIGAEGRGTATITTASRTLNLRIALADHSQAYLISSVTTGPIGSGTLDLQDEAAFDTANITGPYALQATGPNANNAATFAMGGALAADGAGHITGGMLDINDAGTVHSALPLTPTTYTAPSAAGRGTLTVTSSFGTQLFVYYVIDAGHVTLFSPEAARPSTGKLIRQPAGPFTVQSFTGGFAFVLAGSSGGHPHAIGGVFQLDGAGNVTSGMGDINSNGNTQTGALTGNYAVADAATGRTTVALTINGATLHYVAYPQVDGANVLGTDSTEVTAGLALAQGDTSYTTNSIKGTYAVNLAGADLTGNPGEMAVLGDIAPNGGTAISGVLDINDNTVTSWSTTLTTASYHVDTNGHGAASLSTGFAPFTTANFSIYVVDSSRVLWLETDSNRVLVGAMRQQY